MKLLVLSFCVAVCSAARLDNTYLPPGSARTAGGSGNFLSAPRHGGSVGQGSFVAPQQAYGAPAQSAGNYNGARRNPENNTPILRLDNENNPDGSYHYAYETGNRIQAEEAGQQKQFGQESVSEVHGSYSYTGDDGQQYTVTYIANENGFQPQGAHLPTPPPIPEAILKSLEQTARGGYRAGNDGNYNSGVHGVRAIQPTFSANLGYHY